MGFFGAVKRFFSGTRKADRERLFNTISPGSPRASPKRAVTVKRVSSAERKGREQRSQAWKREQAKQEAAQAERIRAGEARAAETRRKKGETEKLRVFREAPRAKHTDTWDQLFAANLKGLHAGEKPTGKGSVRRTERIRSQSKSAKRGPRSLAANLKLFEAISLPKKANNGFGSDSAIRAAFGPLPRGVGTRSISSSLLTLKNGKSKSANRKQLQKNLANLFKNYKPVKKGSNNPFDIFNKAPKRAAGMDM